ncbi:hypothetical protein FJM67_15860 [Maribrevibacterium harenarium]|uniref:Lipoprotein n=1 Tax=Maribrevibacterium harenarium TaxID=2589817 RepID=A0A501WDN5_9GAMM|nr:hypothetical protein [Maribrevibacterium harenarium]TPE46595.1 hypothetical protein FJM67_15860 [Maribrevibacterium harenarium]
MKKFFFGLGASVLVVACSAPTLTTKQALQYESIDAVIQDKFSYSKKVFFNSADMSQIETPTSLAKSYCEGNGGVFIQKNSARLQRVYTLSIHDPNKTQKYAEGLVGMFVCNMPREHDSWGINVNPTKQGRGGAGGASSIATLELETLNYEGLQANKLIAEIESREAENRINQAEMARSKFLARSTELKQVGQQVCSPSNQLGYVDAVSESSAIKVNIVGKVMTSKNYFMFYDNISTFTVQNLNEYIWSSSDQWSSCSFQKQQ